MTTMKHTKKYYLSLPYPEKLKALRTALDINIHLFLIVARYYGEASVENGGLTVRTIDKEFAKGLKRKHYFKSNLND